MFSSDAGHLFSVIAAQRHAADGAEQFKADLIASIPRLRATASALTGNRAAGDDLAQEAVLRAWQGRAGFSPGSNFEAWLFRIMRNHHVSEMRKGRLRRTVTLDLESDGIPAADDSSAGVRMEDLSRALTSLTYEQREAIALVGAGGWSYEAAATYAGCPLGTMKTRVWRARRTLARALDDGPLTSRGAVPREGLNALAAIIQEAERTPRQRRA